MNSWASVVRLWFCPSQLHESTMAIQPLMKIKGKCREKGRLTGILRAKLANRFREKAPGPARAEYTISSLLCFKRSAKKGNSE